MRHRDRCSASKADKLVWPPLPATLGRSYTETERRKAAISFRYYLFANLQHWTITYGVIAKGRKRRRCEFSRDRER